jgi:adenylate kinase
MKKIFLGPPGSGKGTVASRLSPKFNLPHISTGDLFRENIKNNTEVGIKAKEYINSGKLVPDEIVIEMLKQRISLPDCKNGFILDGFPRNLEQAQKLAEIADIDLVVNMDVTEDVVIGRLSSRVSCSKCNEIYNLKHLPSKQEGICDKCGGEVKRRKDDEPETIKNRLKIYQKQTQPLIDFYKNQGILTNVFCDKLEQTPQETFESVLRAIEEFNKELGLVPESPFEKDPEEE